MAAERRTWEIRAAGNDALLERVEADSEMEALVAYARGLPAEVTVEARADGSLLGRLARYAVVAISRPSTADVVAFYRADVDAAALAAMRARRHPYGYSLREVEAEEAAAAEAATEREAALAEMLARQTRRRLR